jgi:hypothetical protein
MADISCPVCGELNPEGLEECQFCHADLTTPVDPSPEIEEREPTPDQEIPSENLPNHDTALHEEVEEEDRTGRGAPGDEEGPETPEWLRRIRIRHASEGSPAESGLENLDTSEWEAGEEFRQETTEEEPGTLSKDFLDWTDPERQASDTVPVVPLGSFTSIPVEPGGPRSGMDGEIAPEEFLQARPPLAFSYNLRITSTQHAHADLLESIVNSEGLALPLSRHREAIPSPLLRWAIAAILFVSILWPVVMERQGAPMPSFPEETGQVNNLIEGLPEEASVLLAFDYDPGFSGEMDAAAAAVIDHLISRGTYLTLVSTVPTGPVLGERFISETISRHNLDRNTQYVNLGFVPGGSAGLLSLTEDLQRALPYTLDGEAAWEGIGGQAGRSEFPPLEGIVQLSDFNLVLVLVDDSSTARSWIEQVQPSLHVESFQTPMAMVVSAQVEPFIRPYYDANPRQVQGFIAGLRGGMAYEQMTGRDMIPGYSWDAFIYGTSTAGLLLLIGGLVGIAFTLFDKRGQDQNGGRG